MPRLRRDLRVTIGIDLGGTKIAAARLSGAAIEERLEVPTPADPAGLAAAPLQLASRLMTSEVAAVGMGVAGLIRWPEGTLVWGPNVSGRGIPYRALLEETCGVPAVVDNDANAAVLAEARLGAASGYQQVLMVTLGTGIGGGLLSNGQINRGRSFAGEVGHMVVDPDGPSCACGRSGCWEQLASGTALSRMARQAVEAEPSGAIAGLAEGRLARGEDVTRAAAEGDAEAARLLEELAGWLGLGLANLVVLLDPEVIVVGGGLGEMGELFLAPVRRAVRAGLPAAVFRPETPIVEAALGEDAGIVGAALLAAEVAG